MSPQWPTPAPLEGVKSKKRAIFELKDAVVNVKDEEITVAHACVTLGSRIAAVGAAAEVITKVLLGLQEASEGSATRHEQLGVLHIGSHLADRNGIDEAMEARPQVLVLSCMFDDSESWKAAFREVVSSEELIKFQGAVVVFCGAEEVCIPSELCNIRWVARGRQLRSEEITAGATIVDDVCHIGNVSESCKSLQAQISKLAAQCFDDAEDDNSDFDITAVAQEMEWTVAALTVNSPASCGDCQLVGYITYGVEKALGGFYLARVAVEPEFRSRGHAFDLVQWMIQRTQSAGFDSLWVNATPAMQRIHAAVGFTYIDPADGAKCQENGSSAWMVLQMEVQKATLETTKCMPVKSKSKGGRKGPAQKSRKR